MSTPRHDCKTDDRKLAIDRPCSACSAGDSEMEHHDHCPPFREGVEAPLEPTLEENQHWKWFREMGLQHCNSREAHWHEKDQSLCKSCHYALRVAEAYAAAVSKNLQLELDLVKRVLLQHLNDEDFEYSLVGLYTKLTENDAGKSPR